ncbi:hypothetical protein CAPTEDRAFT_226350 [Capitella teleta]|uniref:TBCC domain-containing protein 1 n=1 Tax=Capitella teleta TaxID=283909 RepID=R7TY56_CAPTE|nr:hypothetical protein CAPTEDRAFT_226350 [Capitella teleta]|eukprot:ELT98572.1 hypothetical protein CAPTEDRAFT_226350 [Capitella teleta]
MASLMPQVALWVKAEPFTVGSLPVPPHARLTTHNIKKIVSYAKNKGKLGYPNLSYSVWKHIACNKLQLPEDIAWMYFTTFDLLGSTSNEARLELDKKFARSSSQHEIDLLKCQLSVPTLQFVLFLHIQHMQKISLRASLVSGSDEWPTRSRSPDIEGRTTPTGGTNKSLDEHHHMTFVLNNLNEIMELMVEPDSYSAGSNTNDLSLSIEAVEALDFLISGSLEGSRAVKPLHQIALMQQMHPTSGYSKISRSFSYRSLQTWLRSHIGQNPFGVSSCIAQGRRLSWPLAGEDKEARADIKRGRIATNALLVPKDQTKGNKLILMSQVVRQTVGRSSGTLEGSTIKIHRCHFSYIYLLSPLRSVSIEKCRNSTILLGAVQTCVQLSHCENVTIIAACRTFVASASSNCTMHLMTPNTPIVCSGNESLVFGPYHSYYGSLEEHLRKAGLSTLPNLWDKPLCIGTDHQDEFPVWEIMNPKDFYVFSVPFDMEGPTKCIPGGLPARFQKALVSRERQIETWQKMVKDAGLSKEQKRQFQAVVESRFQEWLNETGHKRELDGLAVSSCSTRSSRK